MTLALACPRHVRRSARSKRLVALTVHVASATLIDCRMSADRKAFSMNPALVVRRAAKRLALVCNKVCAVAFLALFAIGASAQSGPTLTSDADFKLLAWLGFKQAVDGAHPEGSTLNLYSWSMAWFKGK